MKRFFSSISNNKKCPFTDQLIGKHAVAKLTQRFYNLPEVV